MESHDGSPPAPSKAEQVRKTRYQGAGPAWAATSAQMPIMVCPAFGPGSKKIRLSRGGRGQAKEHRPSLALVKTTNSREGRRYTRFRNKKGGRSMHCKNIVMRGTPCDYAAALMETEVFRENRLSLYTGVSVSDLTPGDGSSAPASQKGWITFLICRGDAAILAAYLPQRDWNRGSQPDGFPGLLTLEIPENTCECVRTTITQVLERMLSKEGEYKWHIYRRPIRPEQLQTLYQERMLEAVRSRQGKLHFILSEYGMDRGLFQGCVFRDNGTWQTDFWASERTYGSLERVLEGKPESARAPCKKQLSFSERIDRLDRGIRASSVEAVRRFANMPLDSYLQGFPEELAELRRLLPMLGESATYQDTAALVYWLMEPSETRPEELRAVPSSVGAMLMEYLSRPLLSRIKRAP